VDGNWSRKPGRPKVGGSTPQLSAILRMVGREVRHRVASAAIPKGYGGSIPSPSTMDGWQSGNAARWRRESSRIAQSAERRALNSEVPRASRGAAATAPSSNGRTPSFGLGDAGSIPAGAAIYARSPIGRRRQAEILDSAGSNPAARTSAALAQLAEAPRSKRGLSRFESGARHQGFLSPQAAVTRLRNRGGASTSSSLGEPTIVAACSAGLYPTRAAFHSVIKERETRVVKDGDGKERVVREDTTYGGT
jgi:hypothetical protein